uniref:Dentin matrix acidic phosphoprotein 1 n=1 Tax=Apteryx owenii TaxID=8824 RepID=A0A8B9QLH6_APTOW
MKTVFLIIFLWALAYTHPVPNHMSAHPRSSAEREDTASEEHMNELAGLDDEDERSPYASRERGEMDIAGDSDDPDPADGNDVDEEIAEHNGGAERIRIREAQHKNWVDHEDTSNLDEVEDQHENRLGQHPDEKHFLEEDVHNADNGDKGERYGTASHGSENYNVGGNGLLYRPAGLFPRGGYRERSDLVDEEDDSGDDTFDENNEGEERGEGPTYTIHPNEAGEHDTFGDNDQNGDHRDTVMGRKQHGSSSSSSSESRSLDHREYKNYIASRYGQTYRRGGDSDSSSQEERYDFDSEEMQGDDPSIFDSFGSNSKGFRATFRSKESSQESSQEAGKAVLKVSDQSEEESRSEELPDGPDDSEEDDSLQHDDSKSVEAGDADSREDSQSVEDKSESEEQTSQSKENSADKSREDVDSKSREELASQSGEESRESQEENSKEVLSKSNERSGSKSEEGQEDRESAEDNSKPSGLDSESAEDEGDQSESREKSKSTEDSLESEEDRNDSIPDEDSPSRSKSAESQSSSHESDSSEEGPTTDSHDSEDVLGEDSTSVESDSSDSTEEEHSHSAEEDSHSREDATNESTSHGDNSLPRSLESENRKRRLHAYHNKHIGDYDDNDCQDGY